MFGLYFYNMRPSYALLSTVRKYYTVNNHFAIQCHNKKPQKINTLKPVKAVKANGNNVVWNDQQLSIIEAVNRRESVFITGSAGTGKTMLMEYLIELLDNIYGRKRVYVTASTGIAACAIRGITLHSFGGVGLAEADAETLLSRVLENRRVLSRWMNAKALVIDEISMVDKRLLDKFEYIAKKVRRGSDDFEQPWGGLQLVVSGDFFQLPPVNRRSRELEFAFEADCWEYSFQMHVSLGTVYRQSKMDHIKLLEGIRVGEIDSEGLELLRQCQCVEEPDETVVRLFPRNNDVDRVNRNRLTGLKEEIIVYKAFDVGGDLWKRQLDYVIAPANLELCKGARVMLTRNLDLRRKFVNGATGTVIGFKKSRTQDVAKICCHDEGKMLPIVKFDSGYEKVIKPCLSEVRQRDKVVATRLQLPLMLAWAMSIHKSQGITLDKLHTDLSGAFTSGMVYVALSRLKSLDGLSLSGFNPSKIKAHPKVLEFYKKYFDVS